MYLKFAIFSKRVKNFSFNLLNFLQNVLFIPKSHQYDSKLILLTIYYCINRKLNHWIYFFSHWFSFLTLGFHTKNEKCHKSFSFWLSLLLFISSKLLSDLYLKKTLKLSGPFSGWSSTVSRLEPLWGGSLLFIIKFPEFQVFILLTSER